MQGQAQGYPLAAFVLPYSLPDYLKHCLGNEHVRSDTPPQCRLAGAMHSFLVKPLLTG